MCAKSLFRKIFTTKLGKFIYRKMRHRDILILLPEIPKYENNELHILRDAWKTAQYSDANAPGQCVAYYSLDIDGYHFPGERPWIDRWEILKNITDYREKRILELGCNLGLLSCYLLKEEGVKSSLAVDHDPMILEAAKKVAKAFCVSLDYLQSNFDSMEHWEATLIGYKPDIVFALSVLNWVEDKNRFMRFLGQFSEVVFEGHDSIEIEFARFKQVGFDKIQLVNISERDRPILHCKKSSHRPRLCLEDESPAGQLVRNTISPQRSTKLTS